MNIKRELMRDVIILRSYFNFRHVSIEMKFISRRAKRERIVSRTQLRWAFAFSSAWKCRRCLVSVSPSRRRAMHKSEVMVLHNVSRGRWRGLGGWRRWRPHYGDASGAWRGTVQSFIIWQAEVIPSFRRWVLFTHRYLSSPVLPRTCPAVMKATRRSARTTFIHLLI